MTFNTKIRLAVLASAVALATGSSAFAQDSGKWQGGLHIDPSFGAADGGATHSKEVMEKKIVPSGAAQDAGKLQGGLHTDPSFGAADGGATHSKEIMDRQPVAGSSFPPGYWEKQDEKARNAVGG